MGEPVLNVYGELDWEKEYRLRKGRKEGKKPAQQVAGQRGK